MGEKGERGGWRRRLLVSEYQVLLLCLLWFLVVAPFTPGYLSPENVGNIFSNMLPLLVVASGQTIVLMTGGIDLSVTSVMALASVSGAMVMSGGGAPSTFSGIGMMLLVGGCVGLGNGLAVAWLRMPPFIVTLTTMMFFSGLGIWMTQSKTIYDLPSAFNTIGKGSLFFVPTALLVTAPAVLGLHILLDGLGAGGGRWGSIAQRPVSPVSRSRGR
jgi:ribose transport system permease protein